MPVSEPLNVAHGCLDKHTFTWLDTIVLKTIGDIKDSTAEGKMRSRAQYNAEGRVADCGGARQIKILALYLGPSVEAVAGFEFPERWAFIFNATRDDAWEDFGVRREGLSRDRF